MVYVIHFDTPLAHSSHYIGFTDSETIEQRMARHISGHGAKILRAAKEAGITLRCVRLFPDADRNFERKLKNRHNHKHLCPICTPDKTFKEINQIINIELRIK